MQFVDFISNSQVFTTQELLETTEDSQSIRVALSRAVRSGRVQKVRTGLYVSQSGRFQGAKADPYLIATTFRPDAVFAYHSAAELHGLAHSVFSCVQFMTSKITPLFSYEGIEFNSLSQRPAILTEALSARAFGSATVTTREQTLVDCMAKVALAGGAEEVVRSFAGLPYADVDALLLCLKHYPPSVTARVGWYLEANQKRWAVPDEALVAIESMISSRASYKLDPTLKHFESYCARWRLSLPATQDVISTWMEL